MSFNAGRITSRVWLGAVFLFLYIPIATLIVLSFNASPLVTEWGGWSLHWYGELAKDTEIVSGFVPSQSSHVSSTPERVPNPTPLTVTAAPCVSDPETLRIARPSTNLAPMFGVPSK